MLQRFARGSLLILAGTIFGRALAMGANLVLARSLGQESFGTFMLGLAIFNFLAVPANLGVPSALPKLIASEKSSERIKIARELVAASMVPCFLASSLFAVLVLYYSGHIASGIFRTPDLGPALRLLAPFLPISVLATVLVAFHRGMEKAGPKLLLQDILPCMLLGMFAVLFTTLGYGLTGACVAFCIATSIVFMVATASVGANPGIWRSIFFIPKGLTGRIMSLSWPLGIESLIWVLYTQTDRLFIGYFLSAVDVGIYFAAASIGALASLIPQSFAYLSLPIFSRLHATGRQDELAAAYRKISILMFQVTLPFFVCLMVFSRQILVFLYGAEYAGGASPLLIIAAGYMATCLIGPAADVLVGMGKVKAPMIATVTGSTAIIFLNIMLIPVLGISGAALATMAGSIISTAVRAFFICKSSLGMPFDRDWLRWALISAALVPILYAGTWFDLPPTFFAAIAKAALYCVIYFIIFGSVRFRDLRLAIPSFTGTPRK